MALALVLVLCVIGGTVSLGQGRGASSSKARHKGGKALSALQSEHAAQKARGRSTRTFKSRNPLLGLVGDWVVIDAVASGSPFALRDTLEALGMQDISQAGNVVSGRLPIESIDALEGVDALQFARPSYAMVNTGSIDSQGDAAMRADDARALFGVDGTGITVGTLSDSFDRFSGRRAMSPAATFRQLSSSWTTRWLGPTKAGP